MNKYAVSVGINDYPGTGNDLNGCVNDSNNWSKLLTSEGYMVTQLLNSDATHQNVTDALLAMVSKAKFGDTIVFTDSSHGSWVPDQNGDEADGKDECIVLYDFQNGGLLLDDEIKYIFDKKHLGVKSMIFSDSCHSGSLTRFVDWQPGKTPIQKSKPRYMPPSQFLEGDQLKAAVQVQHVAPKGKPRAGVALISGCADAEYSYDAFINNTPQGAFSAYAFQAYTHGISLGAWYKRIRELLPNSQYPQTPQLTASSYQKLAYRL